MESGNGTQGSLDDETKPVFGEAKELSPQPPAGAESAPGPADAVPANGPILLPRIAGQNIKIKDPPERSGSTGLAQDRAIETVALFRRARRGDEQALNTFLASIESDIRRLVHAGLGGKFRQADRNDLDDVTEACLRAVADAFVRGDPALDWFESWLERVVRNKTADLKRAKRALARLVSLEELSRSESTQLSVGLNPHPGRGELEGTLSRLPAALQAVFRLRFIDGLPDHRIAEELGISVRQGRYRAALALLRLRKDAGLKDSLSLWAV